VKRLPERPLYELVQLIGGDSSSRQRVELVVAWHLNAHGLAWPSIETMRHCLLDVWPLDSRPARGRTAPGTGRATIFRALAATSLYVTVAGLADRHRQARGGWFAHGALRSLTDPARILIGLDVTLAEALEWAAETGLSEPLDELPSRRFRPLNETQAPPRNPADSRLSLIPNETRRENSKNTSGRGKGDNRARELELGFDVAAALLPRVRHEGE
jgi:hypothetical protein